MPTSTILATTLPDDDAWRDAVRSAAAFLASFRSPDTRKGYRRDLQCWLEFCAAQRLHPYVGVRRTHVEVYLRQLEQQLPPLANSTLRRRISTLSSWFTWLEDEGSASGTPLHEFVARDGMPRPQPWPAAVARSQRAHRPARRLRG